MDGNNTCMCNGKCCEGGCGMGKGMVGGMMCGGGYGHRMMGCGGHYLVRKVVMIVVLVAVFCLGTKLGELRALMHYQHGGMMMENYYGDNTVMPQ